jgi:hypothetical protein
MAYGYNESFVGGQPPVQIQRVGGWKLLLGAMLAAAGVGFAGYVYLGPYQKLTKALSSLTTELVDERTASQDLVAEREKLKAELTRRDSVERDKSETDAKKQRIVEAFSAEMKAALGAFGATLNANDSSASVGFSTASMFEQPTSTVISPQGDAALKVLAAAVKKGGRLVVLDPEVAAAFRESEAVNSVLRALLQTMPARPEGQATGS